VLAKRTPVSSAWAVNAVARAIKSSLQCPKFNAPEDDRGVIDVEDSSHFTYVDIRCSTERRTKIYATYSHNAISFGFPAPRQ